MPPTAPRGAVSISGDQPALALAAQARGRGCPPPVQRRERFVTRMGRNRKAGSVSAANRAVPRRGVAQPFPLQRNQKPPIKEAVRNPHGPTMPEKEQKRPRTFEQDRPLQRQ